MKSTGVFSLPTKRDGSRFNGSGQLLTRDIRQLDRGRESFLLTGSVPVA